MKCFRSGYYSDFTIEWISAFFYLLGMCLLLSCTKGKIEILPQPMAVESKVPHNSENLVIVTLDGFRWEEVFKGVDSYLLAHNNEAQLDEDEIKNRFGKSNDTASRTRLLPFFWQTIAREGQLYGNRELGNKVNVANPYWLSYPGYNEMFTGQVNPHINSNDYGENSGYNVLEFFNSQPGYKGGKVAAFCIWPKFKEILNVRRNELYILTYDSKVAMRSYITDSVNPIIRQSVESLPFIPVNNGYFKRDESIYIAAKNYLQNIRPRVLYISLTSTDKYGHDDKYASYLYAAYNTDLLIKDLWQYLQTDPNYKNKTTLFITTDHGRGKMDEWKEHGNRIRSSDEIWFAVIGPDTPSYGEMNNTGIWYQKQMASTFGVFMGFKLKGVSDLGQPIKGID